MKRGVFIIIGLGFILLFAIIVFFLARSGAGNGQLANDITIWSPFDENDGYRRMAASFLADNPGVKVDFRYIKAKDAKEYEAIVVDAIASGSGPDIWLVRNDWLPKHQPKLSPAPDTLDWGKVDEDGNTGLDQLLSRAVVEQNSRNGRLYGMPLAVDTLALYVNRDIIRQILNESVESSDEASVLDKDPLTWKDVQAMSRLITQIDAGKINRSGLALGTVANSYAPTDVYNAFLLQLNGRLFTNDETGAAIHVPGENGVPGREALAYYTGFANPKNPDYTWSPSLGDPVEAFIDGKVAMLVAFSSVQKSLIAHRDRLDNVVVHPLPQQRELVLPTDKRVDYAAYWTHVVSKSSGKPALAWSLLQALSQSPELDNYGETYLKPTIDLINLGSKATKTDLGNYQLFTAQATTSVSPVKLEWQQDDELVQDMITDVSDKGLSVQAAVDSAAERLKKRFD